MTQSHWAVRRCQCFLSSFFSRRRWQLWWTWEWSKVLWNDWMGLIGPRTIKIREAHLLNTYFKHGFAIKWCMHIHTVHCIRWDILEHFASSPNVECSDVFKSTGLVACQRSRQWPYVAVAPQVSSWPVWSASAWNWCHSFSMFGWTMAWDGYSQLRLGTCTIFLILVNKHTFWRQKNSVLLKRC